MMFTVTEFASLNDVHPTYRILKPWWDVFMDYLSLVMLMLALFAMTMQITKDQLACLPFMDETQEDSRNDSDPAQNAQQVATAINIKSAVQNFQPEYEDTDKREENCRDRPQAPGIKTNLDFQQYVFINQMCYHLVLPWYSKFFPYLILINTIILMVSSNFWFKFPKTSSKIEHFVSILCRCFESPWTTKAVSETACEESEKNKQRLSGTSFAHHTASLEGNEEGSGSMTTSPALEGVVSADNPIAEAPTATMPILDKKDGEQAKALFEKVRKFRAHVEDNDFIYRFYAAQTIFKTATFISMLSYTSSFLVKIHFEHICETDVKALVGYGRFYCTHNMAFMLEKVLFCYIALMILYGMVCLYSLFWVFRGPLKEYSFEKVREESSFSDIPDVKNDFAFLLHMVDQYDQLYSKRFGVFLSEVSENKLREISLNHEWNFKKARKCVTRNAQDQQELHLKNLFGLPNVVFDLTDLEVLKLEKIPEVRFIANVSQMTSLRELHLYECPAKVEQTGFAFLRDHLHSLHISFTDVAEIPTWIFLLRNLRQLYIVGNLSSENNRMFGLESMRDLRHLKILYLKSNLPKLPTNITDVSQHLVKLMVHNDGTRLFGLNTLKKMTNLIDLELHSCELEKIPHAIFSLINLQELDLKSNNIRTIEEIVSLQHLKRLTCLKLWHNKITSIPSSIVQGKSLEALHLSHNKLQSLPPALFKLPKLQSLHLAHNLIQVLPQDVGLLQDLLDLDMTSNKLETLPKNLFKCTKLRVLCLGYNDLRELSEAVGDLVQLNHLELKGNSLERLPAQLGNCRRLLRSEFLVEDHLYMTLPVDVRESIGRDSNIASTSVL
ncbi:volume-regulated anion channel subunit LRRC8D isoform X2 [Syngnathus acus]|uniref:volume-regulated anion channel subunit LRRC8D isoform X1 n=1 Tax=Syngnathus acus TaxID=161584 RepID=UPI001885F205|nr:volume-regulated anion channel subunit LRRC8D isoform X1 [Syngnathus acus]XP_037132523.1 volume-regulated anion channel subunit LRRC8D isoform X2 [Syngnathus acus]